MNKLPKFRKKYIVIVIFSVVVIVAFLYINYMKEKGNRSISTKINSSVFPAPDYTPAETTLSTVTEISLTQESLPAIKEKTELESIEDLRSQYNNVDIVGYLFIADTTIDYPVVQAKDNKFYLGVGEIPISVKYLQVNFQTDEKFMELVSELTLYRMFDTSISIDATDRILNLSTCASTNGNKRLVVSAKLVTDESIIASVRPLLSTTRNE